MIFYASECNFSTNSYTLSESESKHCIKVLRKTIGNTIEIINGMGLQLTCKIIDDHYKRCKVEVISRKEHPNNPNHIHIAMAIPKSGERLEWFMEKATEIGISEITPLICRYSERNKFNYQRSIKILVSAMKQSMRYRLPIINYPENFKDYIISKNQDNINSFIAICSDSNINLLKKKLIKGNDSQVMIGPEGGFSKTEINLAKKAKFTTVSLGNNRLRTETAGVVVCSIFKIIN